MGCRARDARWKWASAAAELVAAYRGESVSGLAAVAAESVRPGRVLGCRRHRMCGRAMASLLARNASLWVALSMFRSARQNRVFLILFNSSAASLTAIR